MSVKKSWDVAVKPKRVVAPAPVRAPARAVPIAAVPRKQSQQRAPERQKQTRVPSPNAGRAVPKQTLTERRKQARKGRRVMYGSFVISITALFFFAIWSNALRVSTIVASGPSADAAKSMVQASLEGTYMRLVPRNSIFFYPEEESKAALLTAHPELSSVTFSRSSFSSLTLATTERTAALTWCGTTPSGTVPAIVSGAVANDSSAQCYFADAQGFIFDTASSTSTGIVLYAPLTTDVPPGGNAERATIAYGASLQNLIAFVDALRGMDLTISYVALRGDEVDIFLSNATRITYVLGREAAAASVAAATLPNLSLMEGIYSYVDLRFEGKSYVKRRDADGAASPSPAVPVSTTAASSTVPR